MLLPKYVANTILIVNVQKENKNDADNENSNSGNTSIKMIVGGQSKDGVAKELQLPVED